MKNFGFPNEGDWQHTRTLDIDPIDLSKAYVVTMVSNPSRFRSRYDAHRRFVKHMHDSGAKLVVVEIAYGKREFEVTEPNNPMHIQLRSEYEEIWLKEWGWNIGMQRIPNADWEYVIFCDNDITFTHPQWLSETVHQLQSHMVVQPFSTALDMGPRHEIIQTHRSFASMYWENGCNPPTEVGFSTGYYGAQKRGATRTFWHPGFAMAFRREVFEGGGLPGLLTSGALGAGDHHMWLAMVGCAENSLPGKTSEGYRQSVLKWQADAERVIKRDIGYCEGTILHTWGGSKKKRYYVERWAALEETKFCPYGDVRVDWQGLPQLVITEPRQQRIRDLFRSYFRARDEDGNSVD